MPRQQQETGHNANLPTMPKQTSAFTAYVDPQQRATDPNSRPMQQAPNLPMLAPFYPNGWNNVGFGSLGHNIQQPSSNNTSAQNEPLLQMKPPVMPKLAGYSPAVSKLTIRWQ